MNVFDENKYLNSFESEELSDDGLGMTCLMSLYFWMIVIVMVFYKLAFPDIPVEYLLLLLFSMVLDCVVAFAYYVRSKWLIWKSRR